MWDHESFFLGGGIHVNPCICSIFTLGIFLAFLCWTIKPGVSFFFYLTSVVRVQSRSIWFHRTSSIYNPDKIPISMKASKCNFPMKFPMNFHRKYDNFIGKFIFLWSFLWNKDFVGNFLWSFLWKLHFQAFIQFHTYSFNYNYNFSRCPLWTLCKLWVFEMPGSSFLPCRTFSMYWTLPDEMSSNVRALCRT